MWLVAPRQRVVRARGRPGVLWWVPSAKPPPERPREHPPTPRESWMTSTARVSWMTSAPAPSHRAPWHACVLVYTLGRKTDGRCSTNKIKFSGVETQRTWQTRPLEVTSGCVSWRGWLVRLVTRELRADHHVSGLSVSGPCQRVRGVGRGASRPPPHQSE